MSVFESLVVEEVGKFILDFFVGELINGGFKEMVKVLVEIWIFMKMSSFNRFCLVEVGVVELLMKFFCFGDLMI